MPSQVLIQTILWPVRDASFRKLLVHSRGEFDPKYFTALQRKPEAYSLIVMNTAP